jgi:protein-S-isoprenylcysteine O-methyltransferase Ste14
MYTGLTVGYAGATFLVGSWWPLLTLPLAVLAVRRLVIAPEERYLADRFGPAYADYRARVRRWL